MYNEKIESLIKVALADGELSEKEKQVLFKRAEAEGIDLDEFEMVLNARLYEKNNVQQSQLSVPKSNKLGDIRKCPACGTVLQSFQLKCNECGYEFRNVGTIESSQNLFEVLQAAELRKSQRIQEQEKEKMRKLMELDQERDLRLNELSERHNNDSALTKVFGGKKRIEAHNKERNDLIATMNRAQATLINTYDDVIGGIEEQAWNEKLSIIRTFPIPNTKEDLLEMLTMATSNAYENGNIIGDVEKAWIQKVDQIYSKIQICAGDDAAFMDQASTMVNTLIQRLPLQYKNIIKLPEKAKAKLNEESKAIRTAVYKKYKPIFLSFAVLMIIGFIAGWVLLSLIGINGIIISFIVANVQINKKITSK